MILSVVPIIRPAAPIKQITIVLHTNNVLDIPDVMYHFAQHSMKAGIARPSIDNANAPEYDKITKSN